ncbi:MAG TPA: sn-glycerol-3-phosphate ABC transporter ATP-binding protein UgpC [Acidimicrobiales bacterium]|nr:sn-glycerol-3-phosphate ABC transporter ATP-binding protein UgpC [Acidimicrobiales bacterium]
MATLTLENVSKHYGSGGDGAAAVEDVGFEVTDGELLVLVGPSGCGKSTLLKLIAGLDDVTAGDILIDGDRVNELGPRERDIAMVFQSYALYPHLTVRKNIAYPLRVARVDRREVDRRVAETAELLQLTDLLDRRPAELSGGQRQRVAMGRAIVRRPRVFLMDEPLSNLDARLRVQMRAEIANLQRELGITTVYVTHDQVEAMTMGTRVAVLLDGRLQQITTPRELYDHPANRFVAGFIGSPPMNLLEATVAATGIEVDGQRLSVVGDVPPDLPSPGGGVVLGLRPEDLTLLPAEPGDGRQSLSATVVLVEELGAEELVHLRLGSDAKGAQPTLVVRTAGASKLSPDDPAHVGVDPQRFHFFDAETGRVLPHRTT